MDIMVNAAKGNRKALNALYEEIGGEVYYLAKQLLQDENKAIEVAARALRERLTHLSGEKEEWREKLLHETVLQCRKKLAKELQLPRNNNFLISGTFEGIPAEAGRVLKEFSPLQRFIYVLHTLRAYTAEEMAAVLNMEAATVNLALEAEQKNLMKLLQASEAELQAMEARFIQGAQRVQIPQKLEEQVQAVINGLALPAENKRKKNFFLVVCGLVGIGLIAGIILLAAGGNKNTDTSFTGSGSSSSANVGSNVKTTGTLDANTTYYADIYIKDMGAITVKLDQKNAPVSASNFVELAEEGFYDGLTFHRIMEGFMMQGGCPDGNGYGGAEKNVLGEFAANGINNTLSHTRGTISMARSGEYNSGSSQFFIVHEDSEFLDGNYAAFGQVTAGMDIVDKVCTTAEPTDNNGTIPAAKQPIIQSITIRTA